MNSGVSTVLGSFQDENKLRARCTLPLTRQTPLGCISAVAFAVLSPLPPVIESPVGYSARACSVALWEERWGSTPLVEVGRR